jgi:hypothetical protein
MVDFPVIAQLAHCAATFRVVQVFTCRCSHGRPFA